MTQKESPIHSLEDEYIKQLQQQIHYLETECQYLYPFLFVFKNSRFFIFLTEYFP
jgi:hypothetical protein